MNLFVTDQHPVCSAQALDDKRIIKMALETAQMMFTAYHIHGYRNTPYKPTHINHPVTQWVAYAHSNYNWANQHLEALNNEYKKRFNTTRDLLAYVTITDFHQRIPNDRILPIRRLSAFVNCSGEEITTTVMDAYKECLRKKWLLDKRPPTWRNANPPIWR